MVKQKPTLKNSICKAGRALYRAFPLILGTVLLVSLFSLIPKYFFTTIFSDTFLDPIIGAIIGSISAGNPVSSYIISGELLDNGVSLIAVTAFLLAWVTVGLVQLPAESFMLGKKFAITRNILSFIFSIIVALITVGILSLI
jgi:hypothetical protein